MAKRRTPKGQTWNDVQTICAAFPGTEESTSYGTPAFKVRKKLFVRHHQDGEDRVVRAELDERSVLIDANPAVFHVTDHYENHPWVLVRMAEVDRAGLEDVLENAWRRVAPAKLIKELDER